MPSALNVVVLAAGEGRRLGGDRPKVLTPLWGRPSVRWVVEAALGAGAERVIVVGGEHLAALRDALADLPVEFARQDEPRGTGHAVLAASEALAGVEGPLLVLYGDCPLVPPELIARLAAAHEAHDGSLTLLTMELDDPTGYGRVVRGADGLVSAIVEQADASPEVAALREVNPGVWILDVPAGLERLRSVGTDNAQGEIYLTDLLGLTVDAGDRVEAVRWPVPGDLVGFNDQRELAVVRAMLRRRILHDLMERGVEIVDPETTYVDADVVVEPGARLLPCTVIEGRCTIAAGCEVGPFSHLRDGTVLEAGAEVGNFTETKKTRLGAGAKAKHLTYLGDATVGAGSNIGAGTITANYDGSAKHPTVIGERAFIGSGTVLVAPADVGAGARTGAGAIVTAGKKVGPGSVWVGVPARPLERPVASPSGDEDRSG